MPRDCCYFNSPNFALHSPSLNVNSLTFFGSREGDGSVVAGSHSSAVVDGPITTLFVVAGGQSLSAAVDGPITTLFVAVGGQS